MNLSLQKKVLLVWFRYTQSCRETRRTFSSAIDIMIKQMQLYAVETWQEHTIRIIGANEIQRVGRGFLGRINARIKLIFLLSAVHIQSQVRMWIQQNCYTVILIKRNWAVKELQRHFRGMFSRRLVRNKLLSYVGEKAFSLQKEKDDWILEYKMKSASRIQRMFRKSIANKREREVHERKVRENEAAREIEKTHLAFVKKRKIYEQRLKEYYDNEKRIWNESHKVMETVNKQGIEVRILRRKRQNYKRIDKEKEELKKQKILEESFKTRMIEQWEQRADEKCQSMKEYAIQCLQSPDIPEEILFKREIKRKIKLR